MEPPSSIYCSGRVHKMKEAVIIIQLKAMYYSKKKRKDRERKREGIFYIFSVVVTFTVTLVG